MIRTKTLVTPLHLDSGELLSILDGLDELGWEPIVLTSHRNLLQSLGVDSDDVSLLYEPDRMRFRRSWSGHRGDVFSREGEMYYLIRYNAGPDEEGIFFTFGDNKVYNAIEVGVISGVDDNPAERLKKLSDTIQTVVMSKLDGRKTRHLEFDWRNLTPGTNRLKDAVSTDSDSTRVKFVEPKLTTGEVAAAKALEDRATRDLAIEISKAGVARAADILQGAKKKTEVEARLDQLRDTGIIAPSYVLECKKKGYQLLQLDSPNAVEDSKIGQLKCPHCGGSFKDEEVGENYSISDTGKSLLEGSHWQTVVVTSVLTDHGIPVESILWNIAEASEEVDILAEVMDELWLFELKDREFSSGDAHPLNYRLARYNSNRTFIVTTDNTI